VTEMKNRKATVRESNTATPHVLRSVSWLGLMALALCLASGASAADAVHEYVGVRKCKTCHKKDGIGNQYQVWLDGKHSKAYETLASEQAKEWGAEAGVDDPQNDEKCVKCHVTAHGIPDDQKSMKFDTTLGVQCESCHGPGKDYRKKKIMIDLELAKSKGLKKSTAKDCMVCHNDESPAWKPDRYTLSDGSKAGFDFEQAKEVIAHPVPEGYDPMAEGEAD
jgi:hypothetical protein